MPIDGDKLGLSKSPTLGHLWACLKCFYKGKWVITSAQTDWCLGEDKHNVHTGIPCRDVDPSQLPETGNGANIYGVGESTDTGNWLCEPCFDKGRIQINGPQNVICAYLSCGNRFTPLTGEGGYLFFVCVRATKNALEKGPALVQMGDTCFHCGFEHEFGRRGDAPEYIDLPYLKNMVAWYRIAMAKRGWLCPICGYKNRANKTACEGRTNGRTCPGTRDDNYLYRNWFK